ncbi:hypothetical protein DGG96_14855 [Legionella qingyii]|uniref:Uncharacterized protein n=1 Tax=Legionella qingyii TaxID=2184757 RepID=A0A317TYY9_9GAMM|nr:hypothetical protein DGG96_14855 [Legionella qingyii]
MVKIIASNFQNVRITNSNKIVALGKSTVYALYLYSTSCFFALIQAYSFFLIKVGFILILRYKINA